MNIRVFGRLVLSILFIFISLEMVACEGLSEPIGAAPSAQPTSGEMLSVDATFHEFYDTLGGRELLGPPLSHLFELDGERCQYTEAVLMCFNPDESNSPKRFHLKPLGLKLGVGENPADLPQSHAGRDLGGGFTLNEEFDALYQKMFEDVHTGKPLTQLRVNQANRRFEQFFENVGFYRGFDEPAGSAHLIPYGAYLCEPGCAKHLNEYWQIVQSGMIAQPFAESVKRLGWYDLGAPLTQPRLNEDGTIEQVYDNVMLYAPQNALNQVRFRPLVTMLGIAKPEDLDVKKPHEQLVFYEVKNGLGHNVPFFFDHFIAAHGGRGLAGNPLTELYPLNSNQVFRQCFESYCLDYDSLAGEGMRVRMMPLGLEYVRSTDPSRQERLVFTNETIGIQAEEAHPSLSTNEEQQINLHVTRRSDGQALPRVEAILTLNPPDLPSQTFAFKPTDQDGVSSLTIPPIKDLPAMSVVEYQICLNLPGDPKICETDRFIYGGDSVAYPQPAP